MKAYQDIIVDYIDDLKSVLDQLSKTDLLAIINALAIARQEEKTMYICGNGGSAADAQHIAGEFIGRFLYDRRPLPAVALSTDTSVLTSIANDYGYDAIFVRQLEGLARPGDVVDLALERCDVLEFVSRQHVHPLAASSHHDIARPGARQDFAADTTHFIGGSIALAPGQPQRFAVVWLNHVHPAERLDVGRLRVGESQHAVSLALRQHLLS